MSDNPFQTPQAEVQDVGQTYAEIKVFGFEGRLGRLRFLSYSFVAGIVIYFGLFMVLGILAAILIPMFVKSGGNTVAEILFVLLYIVVLIIVSLVQAQYGVRRLHDIGWSGWLWLLMLIPFVNLVMGLFLLFAPGTDSANRFGPPPPPNTTGVWIGAIGVPFGICAFLGLLMAISVPQYREHVSKRESAASSLDFRTLLRNLQENSASAEETQRFLKDLPNQTTQYPQLQLAVVDNDIQIRFKRPTDWHKVRILLKSRLDNNGVTWKCSTENSSSKDNDYMFEKMRKQCDEY